MSITASSARPNSESTQVTNTSPQEGEDTSARIWIAGPLKPRQILIMTAWIVGIAQTLVAITMMTVQITQQSQLPVSGATTRSGTMSGKVTLKTEAGTDQSPTT